jgi:hypothetical protein
MQHERETYQDAEIDLDGNAFVESIFERCTLVFQGTGAITLEACLFNDCRWRFDGYAKSTLGFLNSLYNGGGYLRSVTNAMIDQVRKTPTGTILQ